MQIPTPIAKLFSNSGKMKIIHKNELAVKLEISLTTLAELLNERFYNDIFKLGYRKHHKIIYPKVQRYIYYQLGYNES